MNKYKIVVVDDEVEIREGVVRKIEWEELGFEIVGEAENGIEALEIIEMTKPDLVMTDIRMPFMDGLELIEQISVSMPATKIVVFSGFEEFEYAQRAIHLGVEEYILKPISAIQISELLTGMKQRMDEELEKRRDIDLLRKTYLESLPLLRHQLYAELIEGDLEESVILRKIGNLELSLLSKYKVVITLGINKLSLDLAKRNTFADEEELIPIFIQQTIEGIVRKKEAFYIFIHNSMLVGITSFEKEKDVTKLYQQLNEVCRESSEIIGVPVIAGIGSVQQEYKNLKYSYRDANEAWEYAMMFRKENGHISYIKDIEAVTRTSKIHMKSFDERLLMLIVKNYDTERIRNFFEELFSELEDAKLPFYEYQTYILEILASIMKLASTFKIDPSSIWGMEKNYLSIIFKQHSLEIMCEWFIQSCLKIGKYIVNDKKDSVKLLIEKAKIYVDEHYADEDLSVEKMCEVLHVSSAYFSTLFKKETRVNFVTYVTDLRIELAKHLLDTTQDKTYIIAGKVGYSEPNYFSYVFKKKVGTSPSKYRIREI